MGSASGSLNLHVAHHRLTTLAMFTWYLGSAILTLKAASLLIQAVEITANSAAFLWVIIGGITIGTLKARYLFLPACRKNLLRIQALEEPRLWQFFRPRFFLFLGLMVSAGALLSRWAEGDFTTLILVATLDISIATALLGSSGPFWYQNNK